MTSSISSSSGLVLSGTSEYHNVYSSSDAPSLACTSDDGSFLSSDFCDPDCSMTLPNNVHMYGTPPRTAVSPLSHPTIEEETDGDDDDSEQQVIGMSYYGDSSKKRYELDAIGEPYLDRKACDSYVYEQSKVKVDHGGKSSWGCLDGMYDHFTDLVYGDTEERSTVAADPTENVVLDTSPSQSSASTEGNEDDTGVGVEVQMRPCGYNDATEVQTNNVKQSDVLEYMFDTISVCGGASSVDFTSAEKTNGLSHRRTSKENRISCGQRRFSHVHILKENLSVQFETTKKESGEDLCTLKHRSFSMNDYITNCESTTVDEGPNTEDLYYDSDPECRHTGFWKDDRLRDDSGDAVDYIDSLFDDDVAMELVKNFTHRTLQLKWHRPGMPPQAIVAWIEHGSRLQDHIVQPRLVWRSACQNPMLIRSLPSSPRMASHKPLRGKNAVELTQQEFYSFQLLEVYRILNANASKKCLLEHPLAKRDRCFVVTTSEEESYVFEATSRKERDELIYVLKLVVSRLASLIIVGDNTVFHEFFDPRGYVPGKAPKLFPTETHRDTTICLNEPN